MVTGTGEDEAEAWKDAQEAAQSYAANDEGLRLQVSLILLMVL